jgi:hypothetical protein
MKSASSSRIRRVRDPMDQGGFVLEEVVKPPVCPVERSAVVDLCHALDYDDGEELARMGIREDIARTLLLRLTPTKQLVLHVVADSVQQQEEQHGRKMMAYILGVKVMRILGDRSKWDRRWYSSCERYSSIGLDVEKLRGTAFSRHPEVVREHSYPPGASTVLHALFPKKYLGRACGRHWPYSRVVYAEFTDRTRVYDSVQVARYLAEHYRVFQVYYLIAPSDVPREAVEAAWLEMCISV